MATIAKIFRKGLSWLCEASLCEIRRNLAIPRNVPHYFQLQINVSLFDHGTWHAKHMTCMLLACAILSANLPVSDCFKCVCLADEYLLVWKSAGNPIPPRGGGATSIAPSSEGPASTASVASATSLSGFDPLSLYPRPVFHKQKTMRRQQQWLKKTSVSGKSRSLPFRRLW